jgi:two-component system sensor histidine kinase DctS
MSSSRPQPHPARPWAGPLWKGLRRRWQAGAQLASRLRGRYLLWSVLVLLVAALLGLLVWLTARYEDEAVQNRLEFETSAIVADLRGALARNLLRLQALPQQQPGPWSEQAGALLLQQRELMRLEWRDDQMALQLSLDSPRQLPAFVRMPREQNQADLNLACRTAARYQSAAYSNSYFVPQSDDQGRELMELCIPQTDAGRIVGYTVAIYALGDLLAELAGPQLPRGHALAFTEADGTRLALHGQLGQGERLYSVQQLLDLPGNTLVVRMQARQGRAGLFPKPLSALVSAMALALALVLALLVRDVRRRQRVEQDLGEALAFRKAMEDSLSTGLRARDLQGRITYVNPAFCKMVGFEAAQLRAHEQQVPYWPPELAPTYLARQQDRHNDLAVLRGGHESVFMRSDGTRFPVLIMEAPLINAQGRHTGWMSAVLDLSEQKRSEELSRASQDRLQASARLAMVGEMASLLSHELNQPLAAIAGYASGSLNILQDAQQRPPSNAAESTHLASELAGAVQRIAAQAERAGKVVRSVHNFVRRREHRREAVAPQDLLEAIMPLIALQARKLGVRIDSNVAPQCPPVLCDRTMVEQVLLNLARNGMQAMQHSPLGKLALQVRLSESATGAATDTGAWVEFVVSDVGHGITEAVAAQLFTPFFTTKDEGMGLGLSLCRTVVEQHGGTLRFEPQQPQGTAFSFTLPAARTDAGTP